MILRNGARSLAPYLTKLTRLFEETSRPAWRIIRGEFSGNKIDIQGAVQPLNIEDTKKMLDTQSVVSPSIAIIEPSKTIKICPDKVQAQYDCWLGQVASVDEIFVTRVRVHEADEHIWGGRCSVCSTAHDYAQLIHAYPTHRVHCSLRSNRS